MKNFKRDNMSGNFRKRNSGGRGFGGRDSMRPQMHEAICDECGEECEVPFKPSGDRPVLCSSCFGNQRDSGFRRPDRSERKSFGRPSFNDRRPSFGDKKMYGAVCASCGNKCEVPFKPSGDRPVLCSSCFGKGGNTKGKGAEPPKEQFAMLNSKLDRILKILTPVVSVKAVPEEKTIKEAKGTKKSKGGAVKTKAAPKKAATKKKK